MVSGVFGVTLRLLCKPILPSTQVVQCHFPGVPHYGTRFVLPQTPLQGEQHQRACQSVPTQVWVILCYLACPLPEAEGLSKNTNLTWVYLQLRTIHRLFFLPRIIQSLRWHIWPSMGLPLITHLALFPASGPLLSPPLVKWFTSTSFSLWTGCSFPRELESVPFFLPSNELTPPEHRSVCVIRQTEHPHYRLGSSVTASVTCPSRQKRYLKESWDSLKSTIFTLIYKVTLDRIAPRSKSFGSDLIKYICIAEEQLE